MTASKSKNWNELPLALQRNVLQHRLVFDRPITLQRHDSIIKRALLPLALANRQVHLLATEIYYESNTFIITPQTTYRKPWPKGLMPVLYPSRDVGHLVRKFVLRVEVGLWRSSNSLEAMLTARCCYLSMLLIPDKIHPCYLPGLTAWQQNFPNLDEMKLVLVDGWGCEAKEHTPIQFAWLDQVHVHIKAKKVEVVVEGLCRLAGNGSAQPAKDVHCACTQRVGRVFTRLLDEHGDTDEFQRKCSAVSEIPHEDPSTYIDDGGQGISKSPAVATLSEEEHSGSLDEMSSKFDQAYSKYVSIRSKSSPA